MGKGLSEVMEIFFTLIVSVVTLIKCAKTHQTAHVQEVNFTECKLHINKPDF